MLDHWLYAQLNHWASHRHPRKTQRWIVNKYWLINQGEGWTFAAKTLDSIVRLARHNATDIKRHIKVQGKRSPYDADWVYWSTRMGRHPQVNQRVALLLKRQKRICPFCRLFFKDRDLLEIDHILPRSEGGLDEFKNLQLLHHSKTSSCFIVIALMPSPLKMADRSVGDKHQFIEEPDEGKAFMSGFGDQQVEQSAC